MYFVLFFRRKVLEMHLSDGVDNLGTMRWPLVLSVLVVFVLVYFSLWKGVRSTGKVHNLCIYSPVFSLCCPTSGFFSTFLPGNKERSR